MKIAFFSSGTFGLPVLEELKKVAAFSFCCCG